MKTATYKDIQPKQKTKTIGMPQATTGATQYDSIASGFMKQQAQAEAQAGAAMGKGISQIGNAVTEIATEELKANAIQTGKENAQLDFAEIKKLKTTRDEAVNSMFGMEDKESPEYALLKDQTFKIDTRMKQLLEKDSMFNVSERVRSDELNEIYVSQVSLDSKSTITQLANKFKNNPESFEAEANKLLLQADGVPEQFRETIKSKISNDIKVSKDRISEHVKKKHLETLGATRNQSLNVLTNEVTQLARDGKATVETLDEINSIMMKQLNDEIITPSQYNTTMNHLNKNVLKQKVIGRADRISSSSLTDTQKIIALKNNANEWAESDETHKLLSQDEKTVIHNELKRKAGLFETKIKTQISDQEKIDGTKLSKIIKRATAGGSLGKTDIQEAKAIALRLGKTEELNASLMMLDNVQRLQVSTPSAQKNFIANYAAEIEEDDAMGINTFEKRVVYDALVLKAEANAEAIATDPVGYTMENPQTWGGNNYQATDITEANQLIEADEKGNVMFGKYTDAVTNELSKRFANKDNYLQHMGNFKILSPKEVTNLNKKYNSMDVEDKTDFLKGLNNAVGAAQSDTIFKQMFNDKPDSSAIAGMFYNKGDRGTNVADDILLGQSLRLNGEVKLTTSQSKELKETIYSKLVASTHMVDPKQITMYSQAIMDHYLGNNAQSNTLDNGDIQNSFDAITNGVETYNGKPFLAPEPGKGQDDIRDWFTYSSSGTVLEERYGETPPDGYSSWDNFKAELGDVEPDFFGMGTMDIKTIGGGKYILMKEDNVVKIDGQPMIMDWFKDNEDDRGNRIPWYQGL